MREGAQPQLRCESTPKPIRYLQDRSGTEKGQEQSCLLQLARRDLARARLPHRCARSSTARQADSYEKVVRRFTDITGKSRSRTRCRTTSQPGEIKPAAGASREAPPLLADRPARHGVQQHAPGTQPSSNDKLLDQPTWWRISTPTRVTGRRAEQPVG